MGVDGEEGGAVGGDAGVFEPGEGGAVIQCGAGFEEECGGGFDEEEAVAFLAEGFATREAVGVGGGEDAEALEGGVEEGVEGSVGGDDEGAAAFAVADGEGGAVESVETGGAGGDGGVGGAGGVKAVVEEGTDRASTEGDVLGLRRGEGFSVVEIFGGGEERGDGAFAGAAEEVGAAGVDLQALDCGEGEADGAVEGGVGGRRWSRMATRFWMERPAQRAFHVPF